MLEQQVAKQLVDNFSWYNPILDKYPNINIKRVANIMGALLRQQQEKNIDYRTTCKLEKQLKRANKTKK